MGGGQAQLAFFIQQHYPLPPTTDSRAWLYMTQVSQGYCIRQQAEHYRRLMSECEGGDARGGGCNAGTLYWQAVDSWPAPTWASIEYGGRRKLLHYFAARFFAPHIRHTSYKPPTFLTQKTTPPPHPSFLSHNHYSCTPSRFA
jgi:beta-mannosidase